MNRCGIILVFILCLSLCGCGNKDRIRQGVMLTDEQAEEIAKENYETYQSEVNELYGYINEYRNENGLEQVELDELLCLMAMHRSAENAHMEYMETEEIDGVLRHLRPDGEPASTICNVYGVFGNYGEIMGRRQMTPLEIFEDWCESQPHSECMLNDIYSRVGIGLCQSAKGEWYWTAIFMN